MVVTVVLLQCRVKDTYFLRISTAVKMLKYCMQFFTVLSDSHAL